MGLLDDFLSTPTPAVDELFANRVVTSVTRRDTCHVCDKLFTLANPQYRAGSYWCTKCGDWFDGCSNEPTHHRMWINTGSPDCTTTEPLGEFIGFAGYNQLLVQNNLEPRHVVTTHPREGVLSEQWCRVYDKLSTGWNRKIRR